jgi:hypothetical protein
MEENLVGSIVTETGKSLSTLHFTPPFHYYTPLQALSEGARTLQRVKRRLLECNGQRAREKAVVFKSLDVFVATSQDAN